MSYEQKMKDELNRGKRSWESLVRFARAIDIEFNRHKRTYEIADPVIKERLKRCNDLIEASLELKADLLMRGTEEKNEDGTTCTVVDASQGRWIVFNEALEALTE